MFPLKTMIPRCEAVKEKHELEGGWWVRKPGTGWDSESALVGRFRHPSPPEQLEVYSEETPEHQLPLVPPGKKLKEC